MGRKLPSFFLNLQYSELIEIVLLRSEVFFYLQLTAALELFKEFQEQISGVKCYVSVSAPEKHRAPFCPQIQ